MNSAKKISGFPHKHFGKSEVERVMENWIEVSVTEVIARDEYLEGILKRCDQQT